MPLQVPANIRIGTAAMDILKQMVHTVAALAIDHLSGRPTLRQCYLVCSVSQCFMRAGWCRLVVTQNAEGAPSVKASGPGIDDAG